MSRSASSPSPLSNTSLSVSLYAIDPLLPPPKDKLVARNGRLVTVQEEVKAAPNGTAFAVSFSDCPQLDASHLVVGRVLEGTDVLEALKTVPYVRDNSESPYFR